MPCIKCGKEFGGREGAPGLCSNCQIVEFQTKEEEVFFERFICIEEASPKELFKFYEVVIRRALRELAERFNRLILPNGNRDGEKISDFARSIMNLSGKGIKESLAEIIQNYFKIEKKFVERQKRVNPTHTSPFRVEADDFVEYEAALVAEAEKLVDSLVSNKVSQYKDHSIYATKHNYLVEKDEVAMYGSKTHIFIRKEAYNLLKKTKKGRYYLDRILEHEIEEEEHSQGKRPSSHAEEHQLDKEIVDYLRSKGYFDEEK
ncbi:MAG: hypothetical protein HYV42_03630 [Candidatus Magasanikbacteria bacterium]|nr:hypothetical protein [Candidatus Magasanikbacteria bacterium]